MKDDRLLDEQDLKAAFRSVGDTFDGESEDANLTLQRALFRTRTGERRRRLTRWVFLPIAAVLAASTAWAGVTGKLTVQSVLESFHAERTPPSSLANTASGAAPLAASGAASLAPLSAPLVFGVASAESPEPPSIAAPSATSSPSGGGSAVPSQPAPAPVSSSDTTPRPSASVAPPRSSTVAQVESAPPVAAPSEIVDASHPSTSLNAPPAASAPDPHAALFAEAHRLHFTERDPARALAAWDRYLAALPNGRFSPEARYNRALALVRLGRHADAQTELAAFANGEYGSYRRDEAKSLLLALASDASRR